MGRGRAPCCDKNQVKRGPWSPSEDFRLTTFIQRYGHDNWRALPKLAGLKRCGKSCRLRWINYLRPDVKRGNFTKEEEDTIITLHAALGNKWSTIASHLRGRTDNEIKNVWNTYLKKRVLSMKNSDKPKSTKSDEISKELSSSITSSSSSSTILSCHVKPSSISGHQSDEESIGKRSNWGDQCNCTGQDKTDQVRNINNDLFKLQDKNNLKKTTTCSVSSYDSNNVSSNSSTHQIDVSWPEDEMGSLLLGDNDDHLNNTLLQDEVNKPEVSLETDHEFWNMLDSLSPLQQPNDIKKSNFGEVENKKWFRYLENELGILEENTNDDIDLTYQQLVAQDHKAEEIVGAETFQYDQSMVNYYNLYT